jgi:hypothetical protein
LLNDHIFKWEFATWFTGKLSDFSGLFFFPFLLCIPLALMFRKRGARFVLPVSLGLTGAIFTVIKTSAIVNLLATRLLSTVFGLPVPIALDPSDLWALCVLPLSWLLWTRQKRISIVGPPLKRHWLTLALASIATFATQPCMPVPEITRFVSSGSAFYTVRPLYSGYEGYSLESPDGRTWEYVDFDTLPTELQSALLDPPPPDSTQCNLDSPDRCYRIAPNRRTIQRSDNGGLSWRKDYRFPVERITYQKFLSRAPLSCSPEIDLAPRDLALLPQPGGEIVLVAMGYQGALLRTPGGAWERVRVHESDPLPLQATDIPELFMILIYEVITLIVLTPLIWAVLHAKGWSVSLPRFDASTDEMKLIRYSLRPFAVALLLLVLAYLLKSFDLLLSPISWILFLLLIFGGPVFLGFRLHKPYRCSKLAWRISLYSALLLFLIATAWFPLAAWAIGLIPWYSLSLALALTWLVLAWRFGWRKMKQEIHLLSTPSKNTSLNPS